MKYGVVIFPGSNCDRDALFAASHSVDGGEAIALWHKDSTIPNDVDCIILPGGFSYGDYLRCGAIARFSPLMQEVISFANKGGLVLGICNGFQILTEAALLPGVLLRNSSLDFICKDVYLKTENYSTPFTNAIANDAVLRIPIAHGEGNYFADSDTIAQLEAENRVVFRYCTAEGNVVPEANPNGSINNIAGIINKQGNVLGLMPHPERACDTVLGNSDGLAVFASLAQHAFSTVS